MAALPMAIYGLEVPAGDVAISGRPEIPSAYRITMAAIDPSAVPEGDENAPPRATLKIIRQPLLAGFEDDEDLESDAEVDEDEMNAMLAEDDSDEESVDEVVNGEPSDPARGRKARKDAAQKEMKKMLDKDEMEVDGKPNGVNGVKSAKAKGKMPVGSDEDDDDSDDDSDGDEIEEFVLCTLDPSKNYQQPLDITVGEDERIWFKVSGTHSIYLTGNYIEPTNPNMAGGYDSEETEDDEDMYDLPPDSDELDDSEDELDDMEDPRITELAEEVEEEPPKLIKAKVEKKSKEAPKGKNKRPAEESADEEDAGAGAATLDELISKSIKPEEKAVANGEPKLSRKQLKKLKKNDGAAAAAVPADEVAKKEAKKEEAKKEADAPSSGKADKKVSFAKELEQGPTPTKADANKTEKAAAADTGKPKAALGVKTIQGVKIDDKKLGTGPAAKKSDRIGMRYIGKLEDGKVFDSNKKGKPFSFKLGAGDVIKGWDIGVAGMSVGQERRITIPPHLAYGSQKMPGIPQNSTLVFDVKMMEINKGK